MLLKQQKSNSMDVLNMSSLTLEEESPSVEDVLPKVSSSKVGLQFLLLKYFCVFFWTGASPCFSLCWSTPLPSMILWWRFQRMLLQNHQPHPKTFWNVCQKNLQKL